MDAEDSNKRTVMRKDKNGPSDAADKVDSTTEKESVVYDVNKEMANLKSVLTEEAETLPKNVLLIGRPSAGKSSLINLLHAALFGKYAEIAVPGSASHGDSGAVTRHLRFFKNMGLTDRELQTFSSFHGFDPSFQLPTVMDVPGLDEFTKNKEDVLKYIIDGAVPEDTEVMSAFNSSGGLDYTSLDFDPDNMRRRQVDRIVFVISVQQDVPVQMFTDVMKVVNGSIGKRRSIPYMLIITHTDCIGDHGVSEATAKGRKDIAAGILSMEENQQLNAHDIVNYCDEGHLNKERCDRYDIDLSKHVSALQVLCKLFRRREVVGHRTSVNKFTPVLDMLRKVVTKRNIAVVLLVLALIVVPGNLFPAKVSKGTDESTRTPPPPPPPPPPPTAEIYFNCVGVGHLNFFRNLPIGPSGVPTRYLQEEVRKRVGQPFSMRQLRATTNTGDVAFGTYPSGTYVDGIGRRWKKWELKQHHVVELTDGDLSIRVPASAVLEIIVVGL